MKNKFILYSIVFALVAGSVSVVKAADIETAQAIEKIQKASPDLESLSKEYFSKNDYEGFIKYLEGLSKDEPQVCFYLASTRLKELAYWQKTKNWAGVYDKAAGYKKEISENLAQAEKAAKDDPALLLDIKYLRWQNTKNDDPDRAQGEFLDLVNSAKALASSEATLEKIKRIGDELSKLEDKNLSRRLYEVYVSKLTSAHLSQEELKEKARGFLKIGEVYLAKSLFEVYLKPSSKNKEALVRQMAAIAGEFAYHDGEEGFDPAYAEAMYKKAFELGGQAAFDSDLQYKRAFNLERMKDYTGAQDEYKRLLASYPDYSPKQNIYFKLGVLTAYAQKNIPAAKIYFIKLKDEFPKDPLTLSGLYQLGLLSQWSKDAQQANEFYAALLALAKETGLDMEKNEFVLSAKDRLKEIEDKKDIKYSLKIFFDGIFNQGSSSSLSVDVMARPAVSPVNSPIKLTITTSNPQTGCMMPSYSYEWSGELGSVKNVPNSPELTTDYTTDGIKVIYVAVVEPGGVAGVGFEMVEVTK